MFRNTMARHIGKILRLKLKAGLMKQIAHNGLNDLDPECLTVNRRSIQIH